MIHKMKSYLTDISFCVSLIWQASSRAFSITLLFKFLEIAGGIANLFFTKYLINRMIYHVDNATGIRAVVLLIALYTFYRLLYQFIEDYSRKISGIIHTELNTYLGIRMMRKSVNLDFEYFDMPDKYNEFLRNQRSASSLQSIVDDIIRLLESMVTLVSMLVCCLAFIIPWTAAAVAVLIPSGIFSIKFGKKAMNLKKSKIASA